MSKKFFLQAEDSSDEENENIVSTIQQIQKKKEESIRLFLESNKKNITSSSQVLSNFSPPREKNIIKSTPPSELVSSGNSRLSRKERFFEDSDDDEKELQISPMKAKAKPSTYEKLKDSLKSRRRFSLSDSSDESIEGTKFVPEKSQVQSNAVAAKRQSTSRKSFEKKQEMSDQDEVSDNDENAENEGFDVDMFLPYDDIANSIDDYDIRPSFNTDFRQKDEMIVVPSDSTGLPRSINRYISRYLLNHQVDGVKWMWNKYLSNDGAILGDDMGMGKSIQVVSLFSILFRKTGTKDDKRLIRLKQIHDPKDILTAESSSSSSFSSSEPVVPPSIYSPLELDYFKTKPVLLICPKSLVDNWKNEINRWGYFSLTILTSLRKDEEIQNIIENCNQQKLEILLISYSQINKYYQHLKKSSYSLIIYDEGHKLKNAKSQLFQQIQQFKRKSSCNIILTGTPIQNDLKELWSLLSLISTKGFIDKSIFTKEIEKPIKLGMSSTANELAIAQATKAREELFKILNKCLLVRKKTLLQGKKKKDEKVEGTPETSKNVQKTEKLSEQKKKKRKFDDNDNDDEDDDLEINQPNDRKSLEEINDDDNEMLLKGKDEIIVLCDLSPLQKEMYEYCLSLPDFDNVRFHAQSCPCGSGMTRSQCCLEYQIPLIRDQFSDKEKSNTSAGNRRPKYCTDYQNRKIDPRAILWRQFHDNDRPCQYSADLASISPSTSSGKKGGVVCPLCILLPCLNKLNKIACHPLLLQSDPKTMSQKKIKQAEDFLSNAFPSSTIEKLGGLQRSYRLINMKLSIEDSGKMKTLREMLHYFISNQEKTLVFSLSTQVLDVLETLFIAEGWKFYRLDGQTPMKKRQLLVDQFNRNNNKIQDTNQKKTGTSSSSSSSNRNDNVFVFLISSRAGGLGLNLNTASKVIIFDVDWNPIIDMQSQDRAYRIGQKEHVTVYRLVSKGTIEELAYMRQLYKQQLQNSVLPQPDQDLNHHDRKDNTGNDDKKGIKKGKKFKRGKFEGVEGESTMRGELFGIENLFQFSQGSILQELRLKYSAQHPTKSSSGNDRRESKKEKHKSSSNKTKEIGEEDTKKDPTSSNDNKKEEESSNIQEVTELEKSLKELGKSSNLLKEDNLISTKDMNQVMDNIVQDIVVHSLSRENSLQKQNSQKSTQDNPLISQTSDGSASQQQTQQPETIAMSILKNIGVNLQNAHRIDEILNDNENEETPHGSQSLKDDEMKLNKNDPSEEASTDFFSAKRSTTIRRQGTTSTGLERKKTEIPLARAKSIAKPPLPIARQTSVAKISKADDTVPRNVDLTNDESSKEDYLSGRSVHRTSIQKGDDEDDDGIIEIDEKDHLSTANSYKRKIPFLREKDEDEDNMDKKKRKKTLNNTTSSTVHAASKPKESKGFLYKPAYLN